MLHSDHMISSSVACFWQEELLVTVCFCLNIITFELCLVSGNTVSHFSYAPLFQGPYFLTKMLESNMLYDNLLIGILSVC